MRYKDMPTNAFHSHWIMAFTESKDQLEFYMHVFE